MRLLCIHSLTCVALNSQALTAQRIMDDIIRGIMRGITDTIVNNYGLSTDTIVTIDILDDKTTVHNVFATTVEDCDKCQTVTALLNRSLDNLEDKDVIVVILHFHRLRLLYPRDLDDNSDIGV